MNCKEVILGFDLAKISPVSLIVDNVILHVKMYLWKCKCFSIDPSYQNFKTFIENRKCFEQCVELVYENF